MNKFKLALCLAAAGMATSVCASPVSDMENSLQSGDASSALTTYRANPKDRAVAAFFKKTVTTGQPLFEMEYAYEKYQAGKMDESMTWFFRGHFDLMKDAIICTNPASLKIGLQIEMNYAPMMKAFGTQSQMAERILSMDPYFSKNEEPLHDVTWICRLLPDSGGDLTRPKDKWLPMRGLMQNTLLTNMISMMKIADNPQAQHYKRELSK